MISCYSNGLMFFQINLIDSGIINEGSTSKVDIKFSDIEEISGGIGRIFIVDNSIYDVSNFTVILTSPVPPMIYEVVISDNNPIMHVQQAIKSEYSNFHFYGEDFVAATSSYIALLVYDRRAWQYCIVIINRKDYTNSFGHSIIPLNDHINRITGMIFTCTDGCNTLFIKDSTRSQIYEIRSIDLVINTDEDHYDEFNKIKHKTLHIDVKTLNTFFDSQITHFHLRIIAADDHDMTPYLMDYDRHKEIFYSYGDKLFYYIVSNSYSGPNLKFELKVTNSSINEELLIPNITDNYKFDGDTKDIDLEGSCHKIFFHSYIDPQSLEEDIMFYCIKRNIIEQYHFKKYYSIISNSSSQNNENSHNK